MIRAEIYSDGEWITGFAILGHSNQAKKGWDIYCAGVSALSQSAYLCIVRHLAREVDLVHAPGNLTVRLKGAPNLQTEAVFQTMVIGLIEIEKLKPAALRVVYIDDKTLRGDSDEI